MPRTKAADRQFILLDDGQVGIYAASVVELLQSGSTITEQANRLDVSDSHLRQWLKANGYTPRPQPSVWASDDRPLTAEEVIEQTS